MQNGSSKAWDVKGMKLIKTEALMRGTVDRQAHLFGCLSPESRVP
jgi:hypothetical protein